MAGDSWSVMEVMVTSLTSIGGESSYLEVVGKFNWFQSTWYPDPVREGFE